MTTKFVLNDNEIPKQWYNIQADMPSPMQPPLHPGTREPVGPDDLAAILPMNLVEQEMCQDRWIDIPEDVLKNHDSRNAIPPLYGALLKNEQDVHLLEKLAFMHRAKS